jgi:hypothetical protein
MTTAQEPPGFAAFEGIALLALVVGSICLGMAALRARTLPRWIGVVVIVSCVLGALGLPEVVQVALDDAAAHFIPAVPAGHCRIRTDDGEVWYDGPVGGWPMTDSVPEPAS